MTNINATSLRDALVRLLRSTPQQVDFGSDTGPLRGRAVGDVLRAQVVAQLPNGRSIVEVDGAPFDVKLPVAVSTGDTLELEVLAADPKPTFALKTGPAPLVEFAKESAPPALRAAGQLVQAQVIAELPNGQVSLAIEGGRVDVKLPLPARVGDTLQLEVRALEPRVALAIISSSSASAVTVSDSASRLGALVARIADAPAVTPQVGASILSPNVSNPLPIVTGAMPAAPPGTVSPALSDATAPVRGASNATPAESAAVAPPIMQGAPRDTATLAHMLKLAITQSGLFYESHQAQWVAGQRPLEELMREPQASLTPTGEPVHPQTIGLVRQQLETLDTRQLVWQGHVWPDQTMEWRIEEDRSGSRSTEELPVWRTSLRLELPRLGDVTALLAIQGDEVRVAFRELGSDTRSEVRSAQIALRDALATAGLALVELKVDANET